MLLPDDRGRILRPHDPRAVPKTGTAAPSGARGPVFWRGTRCLSTGFEGFAGLVGDLVGEYGERTMGRRRNCDTYIASRPRSQLSTHQSQYKSSTIPEGGHDKVA